MSVTSYVLVVRPPDRFVFSSESIVKIHNENSCEIIWISIIKVGLININIKGENIIFTIKQLHCFVSENMISAFYIDNYFNKENALLISYLNNLPLYVVNYGVYHCKDLFNYTWARFYKLNFPLLIFTKLTLLTKDFYFFYFTKKNLSIRRHVYKKSTVIFWNEYSRTNFIRDYPYAQAIMIQINDFNNRYRGSKIKILVAPSQLGGRRGVSGREELNLWISHLMKIRKNFPESTIHISLHPVYNGSYSEDLIELDWVTVFIGIPSEKVREYSYVFTDTSTLFWSAESYGVKAYFLEGYKIPKKYFDPEMIEKAQYF